MEAILRNIPEHNWLTYIFIAIGLLMGLVNFIDQKRLHQLLTVPYSSFYFSVYERLQDNSIRIFNVLLFIVSQLTFGIFIYFLMYRFYPQTLHTAFPFVKIIVVILLYWVVKFLILRFVAWVFDVVALHKDIIYYKMSILYGINFYLLGMIVFATYYFDWKGNYIQFVGIVFLILILIRYIRFFTFLQRTPFFSLFYFILYLCTLEIAPLILIYKWIVN